MTTITPTGLEQIAAMFASAKTQQRAAFLPYFPIGYPTYGQSLDMIAAMADAGANGFEIGVPFSDPLADGPTIQAATQVALENGITMRHCLAAVAELRARSIEQPMLLMSYLNPVLAYGPEALVYDAQAAGVQGLVVPDLPPEESAVLAEVCAQEGLANVCFLAPTSNDARIQLVAERATGFIYAVSVTGVTGARAELPAEVPDFIARVRTHTDKPLVLGFGISQAEQARQMDTLVDGYIVGSALVRAANESVDTVRELAAALRG
ncbi:MAG: tryptophan synthase subunit alpha [Chloroflexi bacterium]|nr:tryptophan synthase subunit alpha [Chloroflexota bacterium]